MFIGFGCPVEKDSPALLVQTVGLFGLVEARHAWLVISCGTLDRPQHVDAVSLFGMHRRESGLPPRAKRRHWSLTLA